MNRSCTCICGDVGLVLIASLGLSLGFAGEAFGQECTNDAGTGQFAEGENCVLDNNDDTTNGGCNSELPVFTLVGALPVTYCGNAATMLVDRTCAASCEIDTDCPVGDTCVDTDDDMVPDSCSGPAQELRCRSACAMDSDCPVGDTCEDTSNPPDGIPDRCAGPGQGVCDVPGGVCVGLNQPNVISRDTDWYLVSQQLLMDADMAGDGNGVVRILSSVTGEMSGPMVGIDLATFMFTINNTLPGEDNCVTAGISGSVTGCWDSTGGNGMTVANAVITISEHPAGIIVFVGTAECDGAPIREGFECSTGLNDYIVTIESDPAFEDGTFLGCGDPLNDPLLMDCNTPNGGVAGCNDPQCCKLVCEEFTPFCCLLAPGWNLQCSLAAIDLGCAPEPGGPICLRTGSDVTVDNYLAVCTDPYGAWSGDGFGGGGPGDSDWGDFYNPIGDETAMEAAFTNGFFMFDVATSRRELFANIITWQQIFTPDDSLERTILGDGSVAFDDDNNKEFDRLESSFVITGPGVDLLFDLTQTLAQILPANGGSEVSVLTQTYTITNESGASIEFDLVRHLDIDLGWATGGFATDSVGTGVNDNPSGLYAFMGKQGADPGTYVTVAVDIGGQYYGAKSGIDPDGEGPGPAMSAGTTTIQWDAYGVPVGWENYIAGIGANLDGESGPSPASIPPATGGPGADGSMGVTVHVSLTGVGEKGSTATVIVTHTYGANTPLGIPGGGGCVPNPATCPYDCQAVPDCNVGINDFLAVLAQWGSPGSCDRDGVPNVGINDFLGVLAAWGPCP